MYLSCLGVYWTCLHCFYNEAICLVSGCHRHLNTSPAIETINKPRPTGLSYLWPFSRVTQLGRSDTQHLHALFVCLFGFLTSSSTTRQYRGRAPRQSVWQFYVLPLMRQSWETMTSVSAGHIILTPTQPVGSGRPQRESNPGPPHQESLYRLSYPPPIHMLYCPRQLLCDFVSGPACG